MLSAGPTMSLAYRSGCATCKDKTKGWGLSVCGKNHRINQQHIRRKEGIHTKEGGGHSLLPPVEQGEALRDLRQSVSSSLSCTETVEPSLWVSDPRSGMMVRFMAVSAVRASAEKIETGESSVEKFQRWGVSVGESGAMILGRLGAEGVAQCSACAWGVPRRRKRGCIRLPSSASLSASLLSSMVTCDGTQ